MTASTGTVGETKEKWNKQTLETTPCSGMHSVDWRTSNSNANRVRKVSERQSCTRRKPKKKNLTKNSQASIIIIRAAIQFAAR